MAPRRWPLAIRFPVVLVLDAIVLLGPCWGIARVLSDRLPWWVVFAACAVWFGVSAATVGLWLERKFNIRSWQNRTSEPANPDNWRTFRTVKGWAIFFFTGRDVEHGDKPKRD